MGHLDLPGGTAIERYSVAIKELPSEDRPRERLLSYGPQALSLAELLAIVLRTGTRERSALSLGEALIAEHRGLGGLARASVHDLATLKGVGIVKAIQVAACVELGKRLAATCDEERPVIRSPQDAARLVMPDLRFERQECFHTVLLDTKGRVMRQQTVTIGSLDASIVHPREVFAGAVAARAASLLVAHNHPSGDPTPSAEDRAVTTRLVEAGHILGIELVDHLVIGDGRWTSMKQQGLM